MADRAFDGIAERLAALGATPSAERPGVDGVLSFELPPESVKVAAQALKGELGFDLLLDVIEAHGQPGA